MQRQTEKLLNFQWLNINEEKVYKKLVKSIKKIRLRKQGAFLFKMKYKRKSQTKKLHAGLMEGTDCYYKEKDRFVT